MQSIIVFASGQGSNAAAIIQYFKGKQVKVSLIVCNNPSAGVLSLAVEEGIPTLLVNKTSLGSSEVIAQLKSHDPALLVLAGFLWKIPTSVLSSFEGRIINLHPALLPKYGGKGMYGHHVHQAVLDAGCKESGITIHFVDEVYDNGSILLQARCSVAQGDTTASLAHRIHRLEHYFLPRTIEYLLNIRETDNN